MDRDELLKEKLKSKKESIKSAFSNRLTYDKWDKKSPIYAYSILTSEFEKIEDIKRIKFLFAKFTSIHTQITTYQTLF